MGALRNVYVMWGLVLACPSVKGVMERRCSAVADRGGGGGASTRKSVCLTRIR